MTIAIKLFTKTCIYNTNKNETILYGHYSNKIKIEKVNILINQKCSIIFCNDSFRPDFYISINEKNYNIFQIDFHCCDGVCVTFENILLEFPFENCNLQLESNKSSIVSTLCKNYSHRLDEWIQYNLKLGFAGIVIFNNDGNSSTLLNESLDNCVVENSMKDVCDKYKGKVILVDYPYSPFPGEDWNNIQRISLHIGVNAFKYKCKYIALIDADEFIHLPKTQPSNIEQFLNQYNATITMQSNILTNKNDDDVINNNILEICKYVGENKYTKTILCTNKIKENEFIVTPHTHPTQIILSKDNIIHYHCWVNKRCSYNESMEKIQFLQDLC